MLCSKATTILQLGKHRIARTSSTSARAKNLFVPSCTTVHRSNAIRMMDGSSSSTRFDKSLSIRCLSTRVSRRDRFESTDNFGRPKTTLVLGSSGALGSSVAHHLSQSLGMRVVGADVMELPNDLAVGWELDGFIELQRDADLTKLTVDLVRGVDFYLSQICNGDTDAAEFGLDAIICANGGWQGDPQVPTATVSTSLDEDDEWRKRVELGARDYAMTITNMMQMNLNPVLAAGYVAQHYSNPNSMMVVMGATAALSPTPGMLGYGLAKTASHHMVQTLGASTGKSLETKSVRKAGRRTRQNLPALDDLTVVGILPTMIDTELNRKADPKGNFDDWTKPADIANEIGYWIEKPTLRPHSGSLVKVHPKEGVAVFQLVR